MLSTKSGIFLFDDQLTDYSVAQTSTPIIDLARNQFLTLLILQLWSFILNLVNHLKMLKTLEAASVEFEIYSKC